MLSNPLTAVLTIDESRTNAAAQTPPSTQTHPLNVVDGHRVLHNFNHADALVLVVDTGRHAHVRTEAEVEIGVHPELC